MVQSCRGTIMPSASCPPIRVETYNHNWFDVIKIFVSNDERKPGKVN